MWNLEWLIPEPPDDALGARRVRFVGWVVVVVACAAVGLAAFAAVNGNWPMVIGRFGVLCGLGFVAVLLRARFFTVAQWLICLGSVVAANVITLGGGGIRTTAGLVFVLPVLVGGAVLPTRHVVPMWALVLVTGILQFSAPTLQNRILIPYPLMFVVILLLLASMLGFVLRLAERALDESDARGRELERTLGALREVSVSRDHVAGLLDGLGELVIVTDEDRKITEVNAMVTARGWNKSEVIGTSLAALFDGLDPEDPGTWRTAHFCSPAGDRTPIAITRGLVDGGEIWAATDVSAERTAMSALTQANHRAHAASTAKSNFLANMSHELRTPLNAIIGYAELLEDDIDEPEHLTDLAKVRGAAHSLLSLINGVLDLSKIEAGKVAVEIAEVTIARVLEGPIHLVEPRAEAAGLDLVVTGEFDPALVLRTDSGKLQQVLTNLLTNAVKFTPKGRVTLHVESWTRHRLPWIRFAVEDTGIGLSIDDLARVFDPFEQAKNDLGHAGTGLGLSICKAFVEMLGGQLYAESELGRGSRFVVEIPVASLDELTPATNSATPLPERRQSEQVVLVVDDDARFLELVERILGRPNRQIVATTDPHAALKWAREFRADLVLLDVTMPMMSGWAFLVRLRDTLCSDTPVVVVSGEGDAEVANALGAQGFLRKPVTKVDLTRAVEERIRQPSPPE